MDEEKSQLMVANMGKQLFRTRSPFQAFASEFRVARFVWLTNVRAAMENRVAFVMQIGGMMVNDISFVLVWTFFFQAVGVVNGWGTWESIGLLGFGTMSFGLAFGFGGGSTWLPRYVEDSSLDSFLLSPRNILWRLITNRFDLPAFGDVLFGAILLTIFAVKMQLSWIAILLMIGAIIPAAVVTLSMNLIAGCVAFYFQDAQGMSFSIFKTFLTPSLYPAGLFPGPAKLFFIFIVPSLVVGGLPVRVVEEGNVTLFLGIWMLAVLWLCISIAVFYGSLRRYESGNAIGLRS